MRVEPCACGGSIRAVSMKYCREAVSAHNSTDSHINWRFRRESEGLIHPRRERPTAGFAVRDVSVSRPRASAAAVEGRRW